MAESPQLGAATAPKITSHTDLGSALNLYLGPETRAGLKDASWRAYRSALKTVSSHLPLKTALGWLDATEVEAGIEAMTEVYSPSRVAQTRAAWRCFARWIEGYGLILPLPAKRKRGRRPSASGADSDLLPLPVAEAAGAIIREMGRSMTRAKLLTLQWRDLRPDGDGALLIPHHSENSWVALPPSLTAALNVLWDHARGDHKLPLGAILPLEPGGLQACSLLKLRRSLRAVADAAVTKTQVGALAAVMETPS